MTYAKSYIAELSRVKSLDLLNAHLAATVILQDRMQQSPRHVRGVNFIEFYDLCDRIAQLMETCAGEIARRVADLGGVPQWPIPMVQCGPIQVSDLSDVTVNDTRPVANSGPLEDFAQSLLDAATVAEAYGDATTAEVLAQVWRDVDRHLWLTFKMTNRPALAH